MKLNKLLAGLGATILTAALAITVSAADPVVVWDFANADDTTLYNEDGTEYKPVVKDYTSYIKRTIK